MLDNADTKSSALNIFFLFLTPRIPTDRSRMLSTFYGTLLGEWESILYWYIMFCPFLKQFYEYWRFFLPLSFESIIWGKPTVMLSPTLWNEFLTQLLLHLILCQGPKGCQDYLSARTECENIVQSICPLPQYCQVVVLSGTSEIFSGSISRA